MLAKFEKRAYVGSEKGVGRQVQKPAEYIPLAHGA